jgi:predicted transcriptional regulator
VARFLGVTKPAVSQIIESMVRQKYVVRQTSKTDRREHKLTLTAAGRKAMVAIRKEQRHYIRSLLRDANRTGPGKLINIMQSMAKGLAQADKDFQKFCMQCESHGVGSCLLVGGSGPCDYLAGQRSRPAPQRANRK